MKKEELETLLLLRHKTIERFERLRDYKNNTNAIMKEVEHARVLHEVITEIDKVLKNHVNFSNKK